MAAIAQPHASLIAVSSEVSTDAREARAEEYQLRKENGLCTRCGKADASDDANLCPACRARAIVYTRTSRARMRAQWKAAGKCRYDGRDRAPGKSICAACVVRLGRTDSGVKHGVKRAKDRERGWDSRAEVDGYARNRYHGQGKRGRQSAEQLDAQDLADVSKYMDHGIKGLAYFRSSEVQTMPRIQREDAKKQALAELNRARRTIRDVLVRHRYIGPNDGNDDD